MIVHIEGRRYFAHFYHDLEKRQTRCQFHGGDCEFASKERGARCVRVTPFVGEARARSGREAEQFSKREGRRWSLKFALSGMARGDRSKVWREYWGQVDPLLAMSKRERRGSGALVPLGSPGAPNVVKTALHFANRVRECIDLQLYADARAYVSDVEGELSALLPE